MNVTVLRRGVVLHRGLSWVSSEMAKQRIKNEPTSLGELSAMS